MARRNITIMKLTLNFYKLYEDSKDATGIPIFSLTKENIRYVRQCFLAYYEAKSLFFENEIEDGAYFIDVVTEGRKVHSFNKFIKTLDVLHVNKKSKEYKEGDLIRFPQSCGRFGRAGQIAFVEFVDGLGLGLDFKYDISGNLKESSQEFWEWNELKEIGVI
ncbi:hypothetical protein ACTOJ1_000858 [Shigella flexneri]